MCYPSKILFNLERAVPGLTGTVISVYSILHVCFNSVSIIQKGAWKSSCTLSMCHCRGHWKVLDLSEQGYRADSFVTLKKIPIVPLKWCIVAKRTNSEYGRGHSMFQGTQVGKERTFSAAVFYCNGIPSRLIVIRMQCWLWSSSKWECSVAGKCRCLCT